MPIDYRFVDRMDLLVRESFEEAVAGEKEMVEGLAQALDEDLGLCDDDSWWSPVLLVFHFDVAYGPGDIQASRHDPGLVKYPDILLSQCSQHRTILVELASIANDPCFLLFVFRLVIPGYLLDWWRAKKQSSAVSHIGYIDIALDDETGNCAWAASFQARSFITDGQELLLKLGKGLLQR